MLLGDQHRDRGDLVGDVQRLLVQAQQEIGAGLAAAQQLVGIGGIDARLVAVLLQRAHRLLQMRKRRIGQAAEIDDIGAFVRQVLGALQDRLDGQRRGVDDLGEDLDVVFGHVGGLARAAEKARECPSPRRARARRARRNAGSGRSRSARQRPGQHDLVGLDRLRQAPQDDVLGHQRRDLHADIEHLPVEVAQFMALSTASSRARARCPVRNRMLSGMMRAQRLMVRRPSNVSWPGLSRLAEAKLAFAQGVPGHRRFTRASFPRSGESSKRQGLLALRISPRCRL